MQFFWMVDLIFLVVSCLKTKPFSWVGKQEEATLRLWRSLEVLKILFQCDLTGFFPVIFVFSRGWFVF